VAAGSPLELIVLGSGTGVPSLRRASPSLLVTVAGGPRILLDLGPGALRQLLAAGLTADLIDYILLSHLHPDHCTDVAAFLFATKYAGFPPRSTPCLVVGRRGLAEFYRHMLATWGRWVEPERGQVALLEVEPGEVPLPAGTPFRASCAAANHTPQSLAWRIEAGGRSLVYTGDTDYSEAVVGLARGADLLVAECSFPEGRKVEGHLTPRLAARMAREADARRLLLTHFYPPADEVDVAAQAREEFAGEVILAEDLEKVSFLLDR
jgi:ribonuclease BN (tRNA processing enzyme)